MKDIVFDNIIFDLQRFGGISVVWYELLKRVQAAGSMDLRYIDVNERRRAENYNRSQLAIVPEDIVQRIKHPRWERYMPVRSLKSDSPFIFHSSYYRYCTHPKAINVTTVHDFTYELFVHGLKQRVHSWQKFSAIRHSAYTVCISENTKRDLMKFLPDIDESRIRVIYNGVSEVFRPLQESSRIDDVPFPPRTYVVFIGRRDSYKNFDLVTQAVAATDWNLVIIGKRLDEDERQKLEQLLPSSRYKSLNGVFDEHLNLIYNHAAALVYPSSYEGFGLPVLEAQRAGCPVIALNASSIPEVIGSTPLLMETLTDSEMVEKLRLLSDGDLMRHVVAEGIRNSNRFSWQRMADDYLQLYQSIESAS